MAKGEGSRGSKRKFGGRGSPHGPTPRRGPPALFVTCEAGRERKCQREALELLHHYYYTSRPSLPPQAVEADDGERKETAEKGGTSEDQPLSLEEELAMLRNGAAAEEVLSYEHGSNKRPRNASSGATKKEISSMKSPFSVYDAGMRGMVCILCTLPDCEMVPYDDILAKIKEAKEKSGYGDTNNDDAKENGDAMKSKESGDEDGDAKESSDNPQNITDPPLWDPVETVRCILRDAKRTNTNKDDDAKTSDGTNGEGKESEKGESGQKDASGSKELMASPPPGSRFISRILPMQATCFASLEEIKAVSISLVKRFLPKCQSILSKDDKEITFKLEIKKRLCSHLKRDQVIETVTPAVAGCIEEVMPGCKFKVNLSDPDFSVRIETCKSLCGVSFLPREEWHGNFNLAELANPSKDEDGGK